MKGHVVIKSFKNGFEIILDPKLSFDEILIEVRNKFKEMSKFLGSAKRAVSFEGRDLTAQEEDAILEIISQESDIEIVCILEKDIVRNDIYLRAFNQFDVPSGNSLGRVYKGTLRAGNTLESEGSLIILGDVNPGANIISHGSVVILGTLYGNVTIEDSEDDDKLPVQIDGEAENEDLNKGRFVAALEMKTAAVTIGDKLLNINEKSFKTSMFGKNNAKIVYECDGTLTAELITREFLNEINF